METNKKFSWNGKFTVSRGKKYFDKNMELKLPKDDVEFKLKAGYYLSRFGFCADSNVVILRKSNQNASIGTRRMTNCRKAEQAGLDSWLCAKQIEMFRSPELIDQLRHLCRLYEKYFEDYEGRVEECDLHYDDPHRNRKFRINTWHNMLEGGEEMRVVWNVDNEAKGKDEKQKSGKYQRIYVNMGPNSSLQGFVLMQVMKVAQDYERFDVNGGTIEFIKQPKRTSLRHAFKNLLHPEKRFYACVFSDDSCLSLYIDGKITTFNLDISGCDSSHGNSLFEAFTLLFPLQWRHEVLLLLKQTLLPMKIRGHSTKKLLIKLNPTGYILPSGSVITTSVNTFAVFMIIWYITRGNPRTAKDIKDAANQLGYILTAEECKQDEDIQFLKHSPCYDIEGNVQPVLNFGVLVRSSGTCVRDLPGSGKWEDRARSFQAGFLNGLYPYIATRVLDNMRFACGGKSNAIVDRYMEREGWTQKTIDDEKRLLEFTTEHFLKRYRLTEYETVLVVEEFGCLEVGYQCRNSGLAKILMKDYELSC